jgi:hypothetical protein
MSVVSLPYASTCAFKSRTNSALITPACADGLGVAGGALIVGDDVLVVLVGAAVADGCDGVLLPPHAFASRTIAATMAMQPRRTSPHRMRDPQM